MSETKELSFVIINLMPSEALYYVETSRLFPGYSLTKDPLKATIVECSKSYLDSFKETFKSAKLVKVNVSFEIEDVVDQDI